MREILFRGKRADTGEWIYGDLRQDEDLETAYIGGWDYFTADYALQREPFEYPVSPETVSEYIGLTDKNGRKIFEHDLLKDEFGFIHEVYFDGGCFMRKLGLKSTLLATTHQVFEVVGNTFDNPELLKINNKLWSESV